MSVTRELEDLKLYGWRMDCLMAVGWSQDNANLIAHSPADLHMACELLVRGCSAELALKILL